MAMLNTKIYILNDKAEILAIFPNLDEQPQSKLDNMSILAKVPYKNRVGRCASPYRLLRKSTCPRISLSYEEAREVAGTAKEIKFEPLVHILDSLDETARVEICFEDYSFVMKKMSASAGRCLCYELIGLCLLIKQAAHTLL